MGTLRYSLLFAVFCKSCMAILLFIVIAPLIVVGTWLSHLGHDDLRRCS
jgi:hypothetical protein